MKVFFTALLLLFLSFSDGHSQDRFELTGVLNISAGFESQPRNGDIRWNESKHDFEGYIDRQWYSLTTKDVYVNCFDTLFISGFKIYVPGITASNIDGLKTECCGDGIDNDGDGFVDCEDLNCLQIECSCTDGTDNDGDGLVDCDDPDCSNVIGCQGTVADSDNE